MKREDYIQPTTTTTTSPSLKSQSHLQIFNKLVKVDYTYIVAWSKFKLRGWEKLKYMNGINHKNINMYE